MNILSIDLGSYSIKFIKGVSERKSFRWLNHEEVIIDEIWPEFPEYNLAEIQSHIIHSYLDDHPFEGKVFFQLPAQYTTNRFLDLPVSGRKKAELMVPFQLEEDLPFSGQQTHYAAQYFKTDRGYFAFVSACLISEFEKFYRTFESSDSLPHVLTTELSILECWVSGLDFKEPFMLIDLGHETTKTYCFFQNNVSSTHVSYIAGKKIDENIATAYSISLDEAKKFKHDNSFFLTSEQYSDVDSDQKEFGILMDKVTAPLVAEIQRLLIGFRIQHGTKVSKIYLIGGTALIKNIDSYFTQKLEVSTEVVTFIPPALAKKEKLSTSLALRFGLSYMLAKSASLKRGIMNFRTGEFSASSYEDLPLHSTTFLTTRVAIISIFCVLFLFTERYFINRDIKKLDENLSNALKNPVLNVTVKERRSLDKDPSKLKGKLTTTKNKLSQDIKIITASINNKGLTPLFQIQDRLPPSNNYFLDQFSNKSGKVSFRFGLNNKSELKTLEKSLRNLDIPQAKIQANNEVGQVLIEYKEINGSSI